MSFVQEIIDELGDGFHLARKETKTYHRHKGGKMDVVEIDSLFVFEKRLDGDVISIEVDMIEGVVTGRRERDGELINFAIERLAVDSAVTKVHDMILI